VHFLREYYNSKDIGIHAISLKINHLQREYYELVDATYSGYVLPDVFEVHVCTRVIHHWLHRVGKGLRTKERDV